MKKENGVTLISITVYIICMLIVVTVIATLTGFFYKNVDVYTKNKELVTQYTKFNSIFSAEVNRQENKVIEGSSEESNYIVFSSGNQYTFLNNNIYINNMKIVENIDDCKFSYKYVDSVYKITVKFVSGNYNKTLEYTIK